LMNNVKEEKDGYIKVKRMIGWVGLIFLN
jgi:hypothetical protein